jgi:ribosomal protein L37AE/L43A
MKVFNGILKWLAVLAFSLSAGLLVIIFLSDQPQINVFLLRILILLAVGFTGGLFMRFLFRKGFAVVLILIGLITNVLAVLIIDYFYEMENFFSFLTFDFKLQPPLTIDFELQLPLIIDFEFQVPTAIDAAQIILLFLISLPAILVFRRKKKPKISDKEFQQPRRTVSDRIKPIVYQVNPINWNIKLPKIGGKTSKPTSVRNVNNSASSTMHISSPSSKSTKKRTSLKSKTRNKIKLPGIRTHHTNNDVKLMGEEEHVCPYCLEEVVKNDSRGVVICPECSTWHHQDCWNVTGACGVAHRNEL